MCKVPLSAVKTFRATILEQQDGHVFVTTTTTWLYTVFHVVGILDVEDVTGKKILLSSESVEAFARLSAQDFEEPVENKKRKSETQQVWECKYI